MGIEMRVIGVGGMPEVAPGDDLAGLLTSAIRSSGLAVDAGDVLVVTQKVVSKAEGRLVALAGVTPSAVAEQFAAADGRDPRPVELALREAARIVRMASGVLITETRQGVVCANSGVDSSNVPAGHALLLPSDPDASARALRDRLVAAFGVPLAVIVSDTFGRPWREGQTNVAIGVAGMRPLQDHRGVRDSHGRELQASVIAVADELASAAELVMGKTGRVPAALVKGARCAAGDGTARELLRDPGTDLFR